MFSIIRNILFYIDTIINNPVNRPNTHISNLCVIDILDEDNKYDKMEKGIITFFGYN